MSISASVSSSASASPSLGYQDYTRGDYIVLPTDDTGLETAYSAGDLSDVSSNNTVRVAQTGTSQFMIHQFKDFVGYNTRCTLTCDLQTTYLPSSSTVYLQIFNRTSGEWDEVDTDVASPVNEDFTLTGQVADLTNYKDASNIISCRVYQEAK